MASQSSGDDANACVEHGDWTGVPLAPPGSLSAFALKLKDVDSAENDRIAKAGIMTFHMTGCAGDFSDHAPQASVAAAMAAQAHAPGAVGIPNGPATAASFLFHL